MINLHVLPRGPARFSPSCPVSLQVSVRLWLSPRGRMQWHGDPLGPSRQPGASLLVWQTDRGPDRQDRPADLTRARHPRCTAVGRHITRSIRGTWWPIAGSSCPLITPVTGDKPDLRPASWNTIDMGLKLIKLVDILYSQWRKRLSKTR